MNMKNMTIFSLLFIASTVGISMDVQGNEARKRAENTPAYQKMAQHDATYDALYVMRKDFEANCLNSRSPFAYFQKDCVIARAIQKKLNEMREDRLELSDAALNTPEYQAWYKGEGLEPISAQ